MRQLAFVPNGAARQLAVGKSQSIGLVVLDLANPFFLEVARGVQDVASESGYVVMLFNAAGSVEREASSVAALGAHRVSGALISPVAGISDGVRALRDQGSKVVILDRGAPRGEYCSVAVDDRLGGREAMAHLLQKGHKTFAFVAGASHIRQHQARLRGVHLEAAAAGIDTDDIPVIRHDLSVSGGEQAGAEILKLSPRPTAVVCANDQLALGVERTLLAAGLSVPDDIAIVGYDNVDLAMHAPVPITSVGQPMYEMGRAAAVLLIKEIEDSSHRHERVVYTPTLIARAST